MNIEQLTQKCDDLEKRVSQIEAYLRKDIEWHKKINNLSEELRKAQVYSEEQL